PKKPEPTGVPPDGWPTVTVIGAGVDLPGARRWRQTCRRTATARRVSTPSFSKMCSTCLSTVRGLMPRIAPISALVLPVQIQRPTSDSRLLRPKSRGNVVAGGQFSSLVNTNSSRSLWLVGTARTRILWVSETKCRAGREVLVAGWFNQAEILAGKTPEPLPPSHCQPGPV